MSLSKQTSSGSSNNLFAINNNYHLFINYIGALEEDAVQARLPPPKYHSWGYVNHPTDFGFTVLCSYLGKTAEGRGRTKKVAKMNAAQMRVGMHENGVFELGTQSLKDRLAQILRRNLDESAQKEDEAEIAVATMGYEYPLNVARKAWQLGRAIAGCDDQGSDDTKLVVSRISLALAQLALNVTPWSIGVFIAQIAVEFGYTLDVLIAKLTEMMMSLKECSTQLIQSILTGITTILTPHVRREEARTDVDEIAVATMGIEDFTPQLVAGAAGALGGCAVLVAALITGVRDYSSQKGFLRHLAEFSSKISKFKGGIYALMDMVKHFNLFVKESVLAYFGQGTPGTLVRAVESLNIQCRGEPMDALRFFSMVEKLNSIEGEAQMSIQPDTLSDARLALFVMTKILTQNMAEKFAIPASAIAALAETKRTLEQRVKTASVKAGTKASKFEPFCVWIAGPSGAGKSTTVGFMHQWIRTCLSKDPERFELPSDDRFFYSANFTQQYHTGYNGQYIFAVDDICQDKPNLLQNSSLMFLIQSKSRVPSNVTQAALEDKLCPFNSKMLICTSNVTHPNRDKEIVDQMALLRRRDMLVYAEVDESYPVDPILNRKIQFSLLDPIDEANCLKNRKKIYLNFESFMDDLMRQYVKHFDSQKALDNTVGASSRATEFSDRFWEHAEQEARYEKLRKPSDLGSREPDEVDLAGLLQQDQEDVIEDGVEIAVPSMYKFNLVVTPAELIKACVGCAQEWSINFLKIQTNKYWKIAAGLAAAATGIFAMYKVHKAYTQKDVEMTQCWECCEACDEGAPMWEDPRQTGPVPTYQKTMVRARAKAVPTYQKTLVRPKPQANAVRTSFVQAMGIKNVVKIVRGDKPENRYAQNALFVKERYLLTNRHFFAGIQEGEELGIEEYPQGSDAIYTKHSFDSRRMVRVPDSEDAVIYEVGFSVQNHRSLVARFFQHDLPKTMEAAVVTVYPKQVTTVGRVGVVTRKVMYRFNPKDKDSEEAIVKGFEMPMTTELGRSGSVIVTDESLNRQPTIFGIQTCMSQSAGKAYFEAITRSQIERALKEFEPDDAIPTMGKYDDEEMKKICKKSLIYCGLAEKPVHQMRTNRLQPSAIADDYEVDPELREYAPSALFDFHGGGVDVLRKSMAGYDREYGMVDTRMADEVLAEFIDEDRATRKHYKLPARLLTDDEVMNGLEGFGLKGVEVNTSPGLPLVHQKQPGKTGKSTWISRDEREQRILCKEQWDIFNEHESMLKKGEMPEYLAYACLKDELRPVEQVEALKTRTFIVLPLIMNLMIRKYFGMWTAVQHTLHNKISSSVGIDVNTEWTALYRRLLSVGDAIEDFDYTDWDRSLHAEWFRVYADRVSAWYGDRIGSPEWKVRRTLMDILSHMRIQIGEHVVGTCGGNKSGCAITAEVNSDVHDMLMLYVWKKIARSTNRSAMADITSFRENVALALYGDDVVKATPPSVAKWFNGNAISAEVARLGMIITPGNKTDKEFTIKKIEEITFLKRAFLKFDEDCGLVRAPLNKAVIQRMMLWVHKSDEPLEACASNVKGALCEAFFWGKDVFSEFKTKAEQAWKTMELLDVDFPVVTYEVLWYNWQQKLRCDLLPAQFQFPVQGTLGELERDEIV